MATEKQPLRRDPSEIESTPRIERASAVQALLAASSRLLASHDLAVLLPGILDVAQDVLTADGYAVWRLHEATGKWRIEVSRGLSDSYRSEVVEKIAGIPLTKPVVFDARRSDAGNPPLDHRYASFAREGIQAMAAVPLFLHGEPHGTIAFYYRSPHTFTGEELELAQTLANIAGAAIANAELFAAEAEAGRRAALLARVSAIFSSSLEFEKTMQAVADAIAFELSDWCSVSLYDGRGLERVAVAHRDPAKLELARELAEEYPSNLDDPESIITRVLHSLKPEMVTGIVEGMLMQAAQDARHLELLRAAEISSVIAIPLVLAGKSSGVLMLVSSARRAPLNTKDMELAQQIADRAAVAIENAQLYREQQSLAEQLKRLNEAGRRLAAELDEKNLLQAMTDAAAQGTGAECGAFLPDCEAEDADDIMVSTSAGVGAAQATELLTPRESTFLAPARRGADSVRSDDITVDPRYTAAAAAQTPAQSDGRLPIRSYLAVPVVGTDGKVFGCLLLGHRHARAFTAEHEGYVEALASHAAAALNNAALYKRAQQEIARRAETEAALHRERQFLALAQKAAHVGAWELDLRSSPAVVTWSAELEAMYGLKPGAFDGTYQGWKSAVHPADRTEAVATLEHAIEQRQQWNAEFRIVRPDGGVRWLAGRGHALYDERGKPEIVIGVNIDVTERKLAEETVRRSEKLVTAGRMAATVAHEINNPLEATTNLLYLAQTRTEDPELAHLLATADQELRRVAHIARQTLGFYRERSSSTTFDAAEEVGQVLTILKRQLANRGVAANTRLRQAHVTAIQGEIRQVISNLMSNAADASQPGASIDLRTARAMMRSTDGQLVPAVRITIADRGLGIAPHTQRQIFEPFFTTKKDVGTGLGLWVTKEIVDRHNGRLLLRSQVGRGTVFSVLLPAQPDAS